MPYAFFNLILQTLVISVYAHFSFGGVPYHIRWTDKLKLHRPIWNLAAANSRAAKLFLQSPHAQALYEVQQGWVDISFVLFHNFVTMK